MSRDQEKSQELRAIHWFVKREGWLDEVQLPGGAIRFRVRIADAGREPFITQWFNDIAPAEDFLARVKEENESFVRDSIQIEEVEVDG